MKSADRLETPAQQGTARRTGFYRLLQGCAPARGAHPLYQGMYGKTLEKICGGGSWVNPPLGRFTRTPPNEEHNVLPSPPVQGSTGPLRERQKPGGLSARALNPGTRAPRNPAFGTKRGRHQGANRMGCPDANRRALAQSGGAGEPYRMCKPSGGAPLKMRERANRAIRNAGPPRSFLVRPAPAFGAVGDSPSSPARSPQVLAGDGAQAAGGGVSRARALPIAQAYATTSVTRTRSRLSSPPVGGTTITSCSSGFCSPEV